jgi:hypothetical protein
MYVVMFKLQQWKLGDAMEKLADRKQGKTSLVNCLYCIATFRTPFICWSLNISGGGGRSWFETI